METNIVGVKYQSKYDSQNFEGKMYSYYTNIKLDIGDIVIVPTDYGEKYAIVSRINVLEQEIEAFKDRLKTINIKIDKEKFLKEVA